MGKCVLTLLIQYFKMIMYILNTTDVIASEEGEMIYPSV